MRPIPQSARVFVVGGYVPNGGTWMAYHLARLLHLRHGLAVVVLSVAGETADHGVFPYDPTFPALPLERLEQTITADDILICNPSFSDRHFGLRLPGTKLCYVQDFRTFSLLDRFMDHYVSVGGFVHDFLLNTYGLPTAIIPPFITVPAELPRPDWQARPAGSVLISAKGDPDLLARLRARLRARLCALDPRIDAAIDWSAPELPVNDKMSHAAFCRQLGTARYLLSLTPAEGFGLLPLEAMAMGTVVLGFDGFGGRHYLRPGENALVRRYPDIDGVAQDLAAVLREPARAAGLRAAGAATAACYDYDRFRRRWETWFDSKLALPAARDGARAGAQPSQGASVAGKSG